jgi:CRP-like cAMP-binding protein
MAGTTRPTTNRVLQELATSGIVILARGRTEVVDTDGLARKAR